MLKCQLTGTFARSPLHIRATRDYDRGRLTEADLEKVRKDDVRRLINYQEDFQYITDGGFLWQDLLRPFTFLKGVESGALTRFFRTNTFYRKPVIKDKIKANPKFIESFYYLDLISERRKVILPGPVSLFNLSEDRYKRDTLFIIAQVLARVSEFLEKQGIACIQFSEPYLHFAKVIEVDHWKEAYGILTENLAADTLLHIPWCDFSHLLEILEFPVKSVGIDFIATSLDNLEFKTQKKIGIGCIDAQNSLLETKEKVRGFVNRVVKKLALKEFFICPNIDLEFLPYSVSLKKLELLRGVSEKI